MNSICPAGLAMAAAGAMIGALVAAGAAQAQADRTAIPAAATPPPAAAQDALERAEAWVCGAPSLIERPTLTARRFNPAAADPNAPWMAKLEIVERLFDDGGMAVANCGAAAVSPHWLLTAAHCVGGYEGWVSLRATLGARDIESRSAVRRTGAVALCHQDYDSETLAYDLALVRLAEPLPQDFPLLRIAGEREAAALERGAVAHAAGWRVDAGGAIATTLSRSAVEIIETSAGPDGVIVAGPRRDFERSLCVGESGAPLVGDLGRGPVALGVFSSVDALVDPGSGALLELCYGREARSYFTALRGLKSWIAGALAACDSDLDACLGGAPAGAPAATETARRDGAEPARRPARAR